MSDERRILPTIGRVHREIHPELPPLQSAYFETCAEDGSHLRCGVVRFDAARLCILPAWLKYLAAVVLVILAVSELCELVTNLSAK